MTDLDKLEALDMPGMTVTIVSTPIEPYFAIRKWENDGLEGGTHRLVAEPVARTEIARLRASARRDAEEIERLRGRFSELAADFERRADACHDLNKSDKEQRDRMRLHGKEAAYRHAMVLARAAHTGEG